MADNPFNTPISGSADWDTDLSADFQAIERGYHVTQRAGIAINTGEALYCDSAGFFQKYNANSATFFPMAMAYTAASSGDSLTALAWGIVRSLSINSAIIPGQPVWVSAATPGLMVGSSAVQALPLGLGLPGNGVLFSPARLNTSSFGGGGGGGGYTPTYFSNSAQISAVVGSLHTFTFSLGGLKGWNRRVRVNANSAAHVELKFYADAGLTDLQYSTLSGGISGVSSFNDRAGFPWDTNSGTLYGTISVLSGDVSSSTLNVNASWQV